MAMGGTSFREVGDESRSDFFAWFFDLSDLRPGKIWQGYFTYLMESIQFSIDAIRLSDNLGGLRMGADTQGAL